MSTIFIKYLLFDSNKNDKDKICIFNVAKYNSSQNTLNAEWQTFTWWTNSDWQVAAVWRRLGGSAKDGHEGAKQGSRAEGHYRGCLESCMWRAHVLATLWTMPSTPASPHRPQPWGIGSSWARSLPSPFIHFNSSPPRAGHGAWQELSLLVKVRTALKWSFLLLAM